MSKTSHPPKRRVYLLKGLSKTKDRGYAVNRISGLDTLRPQMPTANTKKKSHNYNGVATRPLATFGVWGPTVSTGPTVPHTSGESAMRERSRGRHPRRGARKTR